MNEYIEEFKEITDFMINALQEEDYDKFIELLESRQLIIENIEKEKIKLSDFVQAEERNKILEKEKELEKLLSSKKEEIKGKITLLNKGSKARSSYNKGFYDSNKIFSKKV